MAQPGGSARARTHAFSPVDSTHWNDGWVIPDYYGVNVLGGWVYEDSAVPGSKAEIFRPTRWTPWLHAGGLFYTQDERGHGRVFTDLD
jgi:hypothetical protein